MIKTIKYYTEQAIEKFVSVRKFVYTGFVITALLSIPKFLNLASYSWVIICAPMGVIVAYFAVLFVIFLFSYLIACLLD